MKTSVQQKRWRDANRANGRCSCGGDREPGMRTCAKCLTRRGKRSRERAASLAQVLAQSRWLTCCENFTHYPTCKGEP